MAKHGGSRPNSGRKKGSGLSSIVANAVRDRVDQILNDLLQNKKILQFAINTHTEHAMFTGWLYIIKNKDTGLYKIGISQQENINSRLSLYRSHNMDVETIFFDSFIYVNDLENTLHEAIENFEKGDWFRCDMNLLVSILKIITTFKHNGRTQK